MASLWKFKTGHFNLLLINFHLFKQNNQAKKTLFLGLPLAREKKWDIIFSFVMENLTHELVTIQWAKRATDSKFYNVLFTETTTKSSSEKWFEDEVKTIF